MNSIAVTKAAAWLAIIAGVAVAILGLVAPLGVWLGAWDFRLAFSLLRSAHAVAPWVAGIGLAIAVATLIVGSRKRQKNLVTLALVAIAAAGLSSLSYYIPETFNAPEGESFPPIHDITTDPDNPLDFVAVLPLRADAPNTTVYGGSPDMTPEKLARLQREAYPDIQPWQTDRSKRVVFDRALEVVEEMDWELVAQDYDAGRIEATATTFWFRFKDDVVIEITEQNDQVVVNARSLSRLGRGDAGANAKRLREFFNRLRG